MQIVLSIPKKIKESLKPFNSCMVFVVVVVVVFVVNKDVVEVVWAIYKGSFGPSFCGSLEQ